MNIVDTLNNLPKYAQIVSNDASVYFGKDPKFANNNRKEIVIADINILIEEANFIKSQLDKK